MVVIYRTTYTSGPFAGCFPPAFLHFFCRKCGFFCHNPAGLCVKQVDMSKDSLIRSFTSGRLRLRSMARRLLADSDEAEDALQDAFVRLWTQAETLDIGDDADPLAATAVRNLCIDRLRHRASNVDLDEAADCSGDDLLEATTQQSRVELVQRIVKKRLTPLQQRIFQAHDIEECSYADIARTEDMTEQALRQQLSRARKTIRECYRKIENDDEF